MKNLNEPLKRMPPEGEVISLESRRNATSSSVSRREIENLGDRWTTIQAGFVDDPRKSVEEADQLITTAIDQITENLRSEQSQLAKKWNESDASTEDLRVSLRRYREFFDRVMGF